MTWFTRNRASLAGAGLFLFSSVIHFFALNQTDYASGWDGYYYVMQTHSWLNFGHLQSADYSLVYPFLTLITLIIGDYILAFKVGAALISGLLVLTAYLYIFKDTSEFHKALLVSAYLIFSPTITYLIVQFPKNVLGLTFLVLFVYHIQRKQWVFTFIFFTLAIMTHRMIGGFCLLIGAWYAIRAISWKYIIGVVCVVILLSFLPGILHISDLQRFNHQLTWIPSIAPLAFSQLFGSSLSPWWLVDLILISAGIIFVIVIFVRNSLGARKIPSSDYNWMMLLAISIFPFFPMFQGSVAFRFFLVAPLFMAVIVTKYQVLPRKYAVLISLVLLACSVFSFNAYKPSAYDPPNRIYGVITEQLQKKFSTHDYALVIVHKSLAEMIIFKTDFDALNWSPPPEMDKRRVLRIVHNLDYYHFRKGLDENDLDKLVNLYPNYYALPEILWDKLLQRISDRQEKAIMDRIVNSNNPMEERPYFLRKGK